jgi:hypothetical protein
MLCSGGHVGPEMKKPAGRTGAGLGDRQGH